MGLIWASLGPIERKENTLTSHNTSQVYSRKAIRESKWECVWHAIDSWSEGRVLKNIACKKGAFCFEPFSPRKAVWNAAEFPWGSLSQVLLPLFEMVLTALALSSQQNTPSNYSLFPFFVHYYVLCGIPFSTKSVHLPSWLPKPEWNLVLLR